MQGEFKVLVRILAVLLAIATLSACETFEGATRDVKSASNAIDKAVK
jgi:predicted small secreted protein